MSGPAWDKLWRFVANAEDRSEALRLVVALATRGATTWDFRISKQTAAHHNQLVLLAFSPPSVACRLRLRVVKALLAESLSVLKDDRFCDVHWKIRNLFMPALQETIRTGGKCTHGLYSWAIVYRGNDADGDTRCRRLHELDWSDVVGCESHAKMLCYSSLVHS